jgi:hypothetical protein
MTSTPLAESQDFAHQAEQSSPSLLWQLADFLLHNKAWWIAPIVVVLMLVGALVILGGSGAFPFLYTIF